MTPLAFSADLIQPPKSQVARYEDLVSERIAQLDLHATMLAQGFGIPFTSFTLNALPAPTGDTNFAAATATLQALVHWEERVSLERKGGRWGLYFTREPSLVAHDRKSESVSIKDASLDVRERFLRLSEAFFRQYLELCENRLSRMKDAVSDGDRTLALLENIRIS